ncbi:MAG: hypothetical protein IJT76_03380 [Clostridia bacterium]|nr:hypothetical protein [Clostridia bacterium]
MKTTKALAVILILAIACSLFAACDTSKQEKAAIVGSWAFDATNSAFVYTFNSDGTGNYDAAGMVMSFTYTVREGKLSILYDGNTETFETEYRISNQTLIMKDSFGSDVVYRKK